MADILNKEYIHFGTDEIKQELWLNIQMDQINKSYTKPFGGLWGSNKIGDAFCEWLMYIESKNPFDFDYYIANKSSSIIKFKEISRLLKIEDSNDFLNLKQSGFITKLSTPIKIRREFEYIETDEIIDYEKISEFYDVLYVLPDADATLYNYSVPSVLALNLNSIEYYKSLDIDYLNKIFMGMSDKKNISPIDSNYLIVKSKLEELFRNFENSSKNYDKYIFLLNEFRKELVNKTIANEHLTSLLPEHIDKEKMIKVMAGNIYKDMYSEKKKILKLN